MPQLKILHAAIKTCSQINKLIKKKRYHSILLLLLSCVRLFCDPMDHSPPGSSVHGIFQARILEWVAIDFPSIYNSMLLSWKSVIPFWFLWVHYKKKKKEYTYVEKDPKEENQTEKTGHLSVNTDIPSSSLKFSFAKCQRRPSQKGCWKTFLGNTPVSGNLSEDSGVTHRM